MVREPVTEILVFKTNITEECDLANIAEVFNVHRRIRKWSLDLTDVDKVLRIESTFLHADDIISIVRNCGFYCEELPD